MFTIFRDSGCTNLLWKCWPDPSIAAFAIHCEASLTRKRGLDPRVLCSGLVQSRLSRSRCCRVMPPRASLLALKGVSRGYTLSCRSNAGILDPIKRSPAGARTAAEEGRRRQFSRSSGLARSANSFFSLGERRHERGRVHRPNATMTSGDGQSESAHSTRVFS